MEKEESTKEEKEIDIFKEKTYKDIEEVNKKLKTTDIKGKDYVEVTQRIKAFRMLYPNGIIETEMLGNENINTHFKSKRRRCKL